MIDSLNSELWLEKYGDALFRYALLRVRDISTAEDLVQETLLAGINSGNKFNHRSSVQTWLTGILKHKIIDYFRRQIREESTFSTTNLASDLIDHHFDGRGHWENAPQQWNTPQQDLQNEQFWQVFDDCLSRLPDPLADIFILREMEGLSSQDLCKVFNISTTNNLWVMLSRTRMKLRQCLETHWFNPNN